MPLTANYEEIIDYKTHCYQTATQSDLGEGETLEELVNNQFNFMRPGWGWTDDSKESATRLHPITAELVFGSMNIGIGEITKENCEEVFIRYRMIAMVYGAPLHDGEGDDIFITRENVQAHIGLRTNVSNTTKRKFHADITRRMREQAARAMQEEE
jgi:hypothetical protein